MKRLDAINASTVLGGLPLNRISNKDLKNRLIADHLALRKVAVAHDELQQEESDKFRRDFEKEAEAVGRIRRKLESKALTPQMRDDLYRQLDGYEAFRKAERDLSQRLSEKLREEVKVAVKAVKLDELVALTDDEDGISLTFDQLALLEPIIKDTEKKEK